MKEIDQNITILLNDLYELDHTLREKESELILLIENLLKAKPNIVFDERFREELKEEILKKAKEQKIPLLFKKLAPASLALAGFLIILLFFIPEKNHKEDFFSFQEEELQRQSFGTLSFSSDPQPEEFLGKGVSEESNFLFDSRKTSYSFIYNKDITVKERLMKVFKRVKMEFPVSFLNQSNSYLTDFSQFKDIEIDYISFHEKNGFVVYVDMNEGTLSMNKEKNVLKEVSDNNINDSKIIAVAKNFIDRYGIDIENFSEPEIIQRNSYESLTTVLFPFLVNNYQVYEFNGRKVGFSLNISNKNMEVIDLWNLFTQKYESSYYDISLDKINDYLRSGAGRNSFKEATNIVEVELLDPFVAYAKFYQNQEGGINEYLIPVLVFPIKEGFEDLSQENIIVPLLGDVLESFIMPEIFVK